MPAKRLDVQETPTNQRRKPLPNQLQSRFLYLQANLDGCFFETDLPNPKSRKSFADTAPVASRPLYGP